MESNHVKIDVVFLHVIDDESFTLMDLIAMSSFCELKILYCFCYCIKENTDLKKKCF